MHKIKPLVSIIIPVYNGANFLAQAVESALNQTYSAIEILIIDDGSDDDGATERVIKKFDGQVKYFHKPNGGIASALNFGISKMEGELFSWLSHDDVYEPNKIELGVNAYCESNGKSIIYSDFYVIDKDSNRLYAHALPPIPEGGMRCFLTSSSALHGCTLLIPKSYLNELGGFDVGQRATQDYDMWFRLASNYSFRHVKERLVGVRFHSDQGTSRLKHIVRMEQDQLYYRFLVSLSLAEIKAYTGGDILKFYFRLYIVFHGSGLVQVTALTKSKILLLCRQNEGYSKDYLKFLVVAVLIAPVVRLKGLFRQFLFKNDSSYAAGIVIRLGRWLLARN